MVEQNESQHFWNLLEREKGVKLPTYMKHILEFNHFDNALSFRQLDDKMIEELEKFAAEEMSQYLDENADLKSFYGNHYRNPQNFKFMLGDRHLIRGLVQFVKEKDSDFWKKQENLSLKRIPLTPASTLNSNEGTGNNALNSERKEVRALYAKLIKRLTTQGTTSSKTGRGIVTESVSIDDLNLEVSVKEIYNGEEFPTSYTYISKIECYICREPKIITRAPGAGKQPPRWVLTNYERHLKLKHGWTPHGAQDSGKIKSSVKRKQKSVLDILKNSKLQKVDKEQGAESLSPVYSSQSSGDCLEMNSISIENPALEQSTSVHPRQTLECIDSGIY